jgi:hypothetical protein
MLLGYMVQRAGPPTAFKPAIPPQGLAAEHRKVIETPQASDRHHPQTVEETPID